MLGGRCSLCNGKLNSKKICKECGLDNSKSEKYYKINQSSCDNLPMTHVHEEKWKETKTDKWRGEKRKSVRKTSGPIWQPREKKDKQKGVASVIPIFIVLISAIISIAGNLLDFDEREPDWAMESMYDPYEYLENEHPMEGDTISYSLESGQYVVGVHIAPGNYWTEEVYENDWVEITDHKNSIYLFTNQNSDTAEYLGDLRLFEGAVVTICAKDTIILTTDNGQTGEMPALAENFVTDSYLLHSYDEAIAGTQFEPGIYDLSIEQGNAYVDLTVYDEDGNECEYRSFDLDTDGNGVCGSCFRNVVIPKGARISCEYTDILLTPSEWIWTTDYLEHYY